MSAVTSTFGVLIDDVDRQYDLGTFVSCEGLGLTVQVTEHAEGGNNGFVWKLPTRLTYDNVTLTRPPGSDTPTVLAWFASLENGVRRTTGRITAFMDDDEIEWTLEGVVPVRYQAPSFSATASAAAVETLEIAHHGLSARVGSR